MRLIDADAYAKELWKLRHNYQLMDDTQTADKIMHGLYRAEQALKDAPTIDAVPVVHGHWIIEGAYTYNLRELNGSAYEPVYRCSCCHRQTESYLRLDEPKMPEDADFPEFCPHCGARMDGERREG